MNTGLIIVGVVSFTFLLVAVSHLAATARRLDSRLADLEAGSLAYATARVVQASDIDTRTTELEDRVGRITEELGGILSDELREQVTAPDRSGHDTRSPAPTPRAHKRNPSNYLPLARENNARRPIVDGRDDFDAVDDIGEQILGIIGDVVPPSAERLAAVQQLMELFRQHWPEYCNRGQSMRSSQKLASRPAWQAEAWANIAATKERDADAAAAEDEVRAHYEQHGGATGPLSAQPGSAVLKVNELVKKLGDRKPEEQEGTSDEV